MTSKEYIKEKLQDLCNNFRNIKVRYEYRNLGNAHIVEVTPQEIYDTDEKYMRFEYEFEEEFERRFPHEEIMFVSENSLIVINKPILEINGK